MDKILAFIDETGDPRFNDGASLYLEYSAVLIESNNETDIVLSLNSIKEKLNLPEFKSSRIRTEKRRIQILNEIKDIDFKFINLVIDKSQVYGDWKNFPAVFYKYTQNILNSELHRLYTDRAVTIDKFGDENYQNSLKRYLNNNLQLTLFENTINIGSAKDNVLIQLADFIAGTHRKLNNDDFDNAKLISELLGGKELHILKWPDNFQRFIIESIGNEKDRQIAEIAISYAEKYISENKKSSNNSDRLMILEYLLFQVKFIDYKRYIYSNELIDWLSQNGIKYKEEEFRKEIIGNLRDDGVVIAGSRKGLKIPITESELSDYLNYTSARYLTIIKRFKETYKTLNGMSLGKIDIFDSNEFKIHKEFFKILDKY
jgi:arsenate reductase-like glutaredoxin family protein